MGNTIQTPSLSSSQTTTLEERIVKLMNSDKSDSDKVNILKQTRNAYTTKGTVKSMSEVVPENFLDETITSLYMSIPPTVGKLAAIFELGRWYRPPQEDGGVSSKRGIPRMIVRRFLERYGPLIETLPSSQTNNVQAIVAQILSKHPWRVTVKNAKDANLSQKFINLLAARSGEKKSKVHGDNAVTDWFKFCKSYPIEEQNVKDILDHFEIPYKQGSTGEELCDALSTEFNKDEGLTEFDIMGMCDNVDVKNPDSIIALTNISKGLILFITKKEEGKRTKVHCYDKSKLRHLLQDVQGCRILENGEIIGNCNDQSGVDLKTINYEELRQFLRSDTPSERRKEAKLSYIGAYKVASVPIVPSSPPPKDDDTIKLPYTTKKGSPPRSPQRKPLAIMGPKLTTAPKVEEEMPVSPEYDIFESLFAKMSDSDKSDAESGISKLSVRQRTQLSNFLQKNELPEERVNVLISFVKGDDTRLALRMIELFKEIDREIVDEFMLMLNTAFPKMFDLIVKTRSGGGVNSTKWWERFMPSDADIARM